ncbi:MAG: alpha-glucan family phosphorylase [Planctomycetales bacterium]|nr:alpha-glucan family phosphorylase [Planctomycetales bacterium]
MTDERAPASRSAATTSPPGEPRSLRVAYFSMEVGVDSRLPTYAGGLGILAGDTLKALADLGVPAIGVTLLHRAGYFDQKLDARGNQEERAVVWDPGAVLRPLPARVTVAIEGRPVAVGAWRYDIVGLGGAVVPLLLLDTGLPENGLEDRALTSFLYGGDDRYRLAQEVILGIGGVRMLRALGHDRISRFHMNEGHSALLAVELLLEGGGPAPNFPAVRDRCVFTTHTPVAAGHDQFDWGLVGRVLGETGPLEIVRTLVPGDRLNMTHLALKLASYVNGVAKRHRLVSQQMFPGYAIQAITNGVHSRTWTGTSFAQLYDRHIPGWAADPFSLRHAIALPPEEVWAAHEEEKRVLLAEVTRRSGAALDPRALTLGFARRATPYKRAELLFSDPEKLARIAGECGGLQVVLAGKAHPRDGGGREMILRVFEHARRLAGRVPVVYLENHDMELAKRLVAGVDIWLNTPLPPLEASGTSGMKAALNGVPSLSVLDGWWVEGCIEGVTGWAIEPDGGAAPGSGDGAAEAAGLYRKLREVVVPLYRDRRDEWIRLMRQCIALNGSYFNAHRMAQQYLALAYG